MRSFFLILGLLCAVPVEAQMPELLPGSRLRVEAHAVGSRLEGTLMSRDTTGLVIAASGMLRTVVPTASLTRVQVSMGRSRSAGAWKGARIGASVMAALGGVMVLSYAGAGVDAGGAAAFLVQSAMGGAMWGAVIGGFVGAEKWTTVYQTPRRLDAWR